MCFEEFPEKGANMFPSILDGSKNGIVVDIFRVNMVIIIQWLERGTLFSDESICHILEIR